MSAAGLSGRRFEAVHVVSHASPDQRVAVVPVLGAPASLPAGERLCCGERRFAELELAPGAADLSEGVSCAGSSC